MNDKHQTNTNRLLWADALRGVLIIFVVIGHALQYGDYENRLSWNMIYSFHMAAFFVVSGYVSFRPNPKGGIILRRLKQLLVPFAVWTLLTGLVKGDVIDHCRTALLRPDTSFWFLYVLFCVVLLHQVVIYLSPNRSDCKLLIYSGGGCLLLALFMVLFDWRLLGFQFIAYYFGFYALGYCLHYYKIRLNPLVILICGMVWLMMSLYWRMHTVPVPLQWATFVPDALLTYGYRFVTAVCASLFLMGVAPIVFKGSSRIIAFLAYCGKISLGIYVLHIFLGRWLEPSIVSLCGSNESWLFVCADTVVKLTVSILVVGLICRSQIASKVLLGK